MTQLPVVSKRGNREQRREMAQIPPKSTEKKRHYCCICSNFGGKRVNGQNITLHRIPSDEKLRNVWIKRLRSVSPAFKANLKNDRLCSSHFVNGICTKENPVPSVFIVNDKTKIFKTSKLDNDDQPQEMQSTESEIPSKDIGCGQVEVAMEVDEDDYGNPSLALDQEVSPEQKFIYIQ